MKNKILPLLASSLFLCSCNNNSEAIPSNSEGTTNDSSQNSSVSEDEYSWDDDDTLKILMIGNSFSDDTIEYVDRIAKSLGIENVVLGNLFIGGCSLATHESNARNDIGAYEYRFNDGSGWTNTPKMCMSTVILSQNWDYISLQQSSGESGLVETYGSHLKYMIDYVNNLKSENTKLIWNMTWAYKQSTSHTPFENYNKDQMTMYKAIVNAVNKEVIPTNAFDVIIPSGTAIQNGRTSYIGDNFNYYDGYHLSRDLGRYVAGLTLVKQLLNVDIDNIDFVPETINKNAKKVAIESANNAVKNQFEVTQSAFKEEPSIDFSLYNQIDLGLTQFAYWNSTQSTYFNQLIDGSIDKANQYRFHATKRFNKGELPVGSLIVIEEGYKYRPEAWKNEGVQSSRPKEVSTSIVEVSDKWWGDYIYRAFNISSSSGISLQNDDNALTALKIYIPK